MTLNTSLIERESRALYLRYIKDPRIPEELCSDIYLEFVKRMKRERSRGKGRISGGGLGQLIKLATRTVFHKSRQSRDREEVLGGIIERNASMIWCGGKDRQEKDFFNRIARFLEDWSRKKENYPSYLRIFMLYHAFHLSPEFIEKLSPCTNRDSRDLGEELEEIKEEIRFKANRQLETKLRTLGIRYYHLVRKQTRMGNLTVTEYDCSDEEYRKAKAKRDQALRAIKSLKFFPSWVQLEERTGLTRRKVTYAYQTVIKAIKESFKDDTYWSGR